MTTTGMAAAGNPRLGTGQVVADYLAATFAELIRTEYLALRRATPSGANRYA
ncbi:MAG: hypothetical protein ACRDSF_19270 [Pseudonocardiaceae bacterium]